MLVLLGAIPVSAFVVGTIAYASRSTIGAIMAASVVALAMSAAAAYYFGVQTMADQTDPVIGMLLYGTAPAMAVASAAGGAVGLWIAAGARDEPAPQAQMVWVFATCLPLMALTISLSLYAFGVGLQ